GDINLLLLPRLCIWTNESGDGRILSGVGPHLEQYRLAADGEYRLHTRKAVFGACGRPLTAIRRIRGADAFVVVGSSLFCILTEAELDESSAVPSSHVHSFTDEIVNIAYAVRREQHYELGLVLRSGHTLCVAASIDSNNRLRVDTVAEYDGAKCGLLMSALCVLPPAADRPWGGMRCVAGSAMGEVRLWETKSGSESTSTSKCGKIGFVISMAVVAQIDEADEATVVAVTENRAINLWRIRYRESGWLQLLQKEEAAHAVRPSAVAYCSRLQRVVSASEDGELCVWRLMDGRGFELLRRFQTRVGAVRALQIDGVGRIIYGSATGSLFSIPMESFTAESSRAFLQGKTLLPHFRDCDRTPIRSFAVVHHHHKYDESIAEGTHRTELACLGEDGSTFEVEGDEVSEWMDNEGSYLHLNSWTGKDAAITVFHDESHLCMSSFHPLDHLPDDNGGYTVLSERTDRSTILTARPTMSMGRARAEPYLVLQSTTGVVALLRHDLGGELRIWRYRIPSETVAESESAKRRQNQVLIVNSVAIDRSNGDADTDLYVLLGSTNGRILHGGLGGEGEEVPRGENTIDFALDPQRPANTLTLHARSPHLSKTAITSLEYCGEWAECTALTKNGWIMRMRVERGGGLSVVEEDLSREVGVEWPVRIERRGEEEYVVGFNARNLVVVSRRLKTCLLSIDCGGGHRQVHVDLESPAEGGEEVERITVYYGKQHGIVRHTQRSLTAGLRQLAWTPHRDKIVYCTGVDRYVMTGSIDGEIVLGERRSGYESLSILQRWYVPETTACAVQHVADTDALRIVIGGPKGDVYVVEWRGEEEEGRRSTRPLSAIATGNDSRIIDISIVDNLAVVAFADAQIAIFALSEPSKLRQLVGAWTMPRACRSLFTKISVVVPPPTAAHSADARLRIRAVTGAGSLTHLAFDATTEKFTHIADVPIDRAALTVIRAVPQTGITVVGSDSGAVFVYKDSSDGVFALLDAWRDAHAAQITDLAIFRSPAGTLRIASVGMDCAITVLELAADGKLSLVHSSVFAVNDPSCIFVLGDCGADGRQRAIVAGSGLEIVEW
ncbi:hypothetical protein PFISCL1PPCAC_23198, partial [Pristionchus fissidentatus]